MKPSFFLLVVTVIAAAALSSCAELRKNVGGLKVGICYEGVCVNAELPRTETVVTVSGKEVKDVE